MFSRRDATLALMAGGVSALSPLRAFAQPAPQTPAETPSAAPDEPPMELGADSDPFEHLLAPIAINGQGPFHFLIDTGANVSCVSRGLADRLALPAAEPTRVHTAVGVHLRPSVLVDALQVGDRTRRRVRVAALPTLGVKIDGILGVDWLGGQRLTLDFKAKTLEIARSRFEPSSPNHVIVPAWSHHGQLTIVDADVGGHRISAMIDSGAQTTICNSGLCDLLRQTERRSAPITDHQVVKMETIIGEPFSGELYYVPTLRLGGLTLGNVPVIHAETHIFELWSLKSQPSIVLGMDLLTQFRSVALDYGRSRVRFDLA